MEVKKFIDLKEELRVIIEIIKKEAGKTQQDIALEMGYKKNYISEILSPKGVVTDKFLNAIKLRFPELRETKKGSHRLFIWTEKNSTTPISAKTDGKSIGTDAISGKDDIHARYLALLEDNDQWLKNQYAQILLSLNKIIDQGYKSEKLLKISLQHIGNVEASVKELDEEIVQEQIGSQIAGVQVDHGKDSDAGR